MKVFIIVLLTLVLALLGQVRGRLNASIPQANDAWRSVETNNLFVIGNADPETLRQVAGWLEFFHAAFGRLISRSVVDSTVPTRVVIFRDEASFRPFKPLYQGRPVDLAGYFQPGEDVNYIAILLDHRGRETNPYRTAFHEYVHLHLRQNVPGTPLWLNEGLAEFYSSLQFSGNEAIIGAPINAYVRLLRARNMLPLDMLLSIGHDSPHYNEQDKTGVFYGQSWALVHYLMMGHGGQRQDRFRQFLQLVSRGDRADKALESAFGMTLAMVEKELQNYIQAGEFRGQRIAIGDSAQASYTAMQRVSLTDAEANYFLGDLLLHTNREQEAQRYFEKAVALEPKLPLANAALGLLRVEQRRYPEAKKYLERAAPSSQNYLVPYLYAYTLSREGLNSTGQHAGYSRENVGIMREQLLRAIKLSPKFAAAHYLLAVVDLVSDEHLDEAETMATKAEQLAPAKRGYALLLAQIHLRRSNPEAARRLLEPLTRDSDASIRTEAQELLNTVSQAGAGDLSGRNSRTKVQINDAMVAEPEARSRAIIAGSATATNIRDGRTVENDGPMPTLDEVLTRYVQAMGGEKAITAVTSRVAKGTLDVVGVSRNGSFEIYTQAPNKTLTVMDAYPMGTVKLGFNGKSGWVQTTTGLTPLKGADLAALGRDSEFYGTIRLRNIYAKVSLLGKSKIGYRDVYVIELQPTSGLLERMFLDVETHLPVRLNTHRSVGAQLAAVEVYYDDWREVDGIKLPFRISQSAGGRTLAFNITEIKHNVELNGTLFDQPAK